MKRLVLTVLVSLGLAAGFYFLVLKAVDQDAVISSVYRLGWRDWLVILGLSMINYVIRFLRWDFYIKRISQCRIPKWKHFEIYLAGFALTTTPGKVGEAIRSLYIKPFGVTYPASLSVLFVERLVDVITVTLLTTAAAFVVSDVRPYAVGALLVVIVSVASIRKGYIEKIINYFGDILPDRMFGFFDSLNEMIHGASRLLKTKVLYGGLLVGVVSWGAEGLGLYLILKYLGVEFSLSLAVSIYAVSVLAGALSFIPGGLGAAEVVMYSLLHLQGVPEAEAAAATLICRIATLWFAVILGVLPLARLISLGPPGKDGLEVLKHES
ncbi:MAG TPA: lysylphosphatidylglycerol synthase transmembrane domain-containing protein [Gammaproteobacteria bacterium]